MTIPEWSVENNLEVKLDPKLIEQGADLLEVALKSNPSVTIYQEPWTDTTSAYRSIGNGTAYEVKVFLIDKVSGKRSITRYLTILDPTKVAELVPVLLVTETGIGLQKLIDAQRAGGTLLPTRGPQA